MTTVATLRTTYLNPMLGRIDGTAEPWSDGDCNRVLTDALTQLWPLVGARASGTVATSESSDVYTIPAALQSGILSRINLERVSGGISQRMQRVTRWTRYSDTEVQIDPRFPTDATLSLRFHSWVPYATDGSDLPARLDAIVPMRAASLLYGYLEGKLVNSERQQGLDSGRVVDYQTAVGLSAYWERRFIDALRNDQNRIHTGPRSARR